MLPLLLIGALLVLMLVPVVLPLRSGGVTPETFAGPDGQFLTVNGVRLYVETAGNPADPALLLVHGMFGSTWVWRKVIAPLAAAGFYVIALDRPGFGLSDKPLNYDYGYPAQADLLAALLDTLQIRQATVVGHSAGGMPVMHFALRHPQYLQRLVIVDAAVRMQAGPPPFVGQLLALPPVTYWTRRLIRLMLGKPQRFRRMFRTFYSDPLFLTAADFVGHSRVLQTPDWDAGLVGLVRSMDLRPLADADFQGIAVPVLLLWGEADTLTPVQQARDLEALFKMVTVRTFPGAGHMLMEEQPEAFTAALLAFRQAL